MQSNAATTPRSGFFSELLPIIEAVAVLDSHCTKPAKLLLKDLLKLWSTVHLSISHQHRI